jgi:acetoin utilization deacetylase AcuC-like enzyme
MGPCSVLTDHIFSLHDNHSHPENQSRLENALLGVPHSVPRIAARPASHEDIILIHNPSYLKWLEQRCASTRDISYLDTDTYITPSSYEVALHAAGAAIGAAERSVNGEHCFALIRPPGHHAEHDRAMGFCLLNNAAIAAARLLRSVGRVAIVDWDIHHGNGTQASFYGSDRVLYCSTHQENMFPYTGSVDETGTGPGRGFSINAPLQVGSGIADYSYIFSEVFVPALARFAPDAVIVSAGQDILSDDPLGGMSIVPEDFSILTHMISGVAGVPLALILEGGYGDSVGPAISHIFAALQKKSTGHRYPGPPHESTKQTVSILKKVHRLV